MSDEPQRSEAKGQEPGFGKAFFSAFMDHSQALVWIKDETFSYRYINKAFEEVFEKKSEEVVGNTDFSFMPSEAAEVLRANDQNVLSFGEPIEFVEIVPGADGIDRHWLVKKFPFEGDNGHLWTGGMAFEITERVEAERKVKDSQLLYSSLVESIPLNVFRKDLEGRVTFMSSKYAEELGENAESILGMSDRDLFPEYLAEKYRADDREVIENEKPKEVVEEFIQPDGERRFVQTFKAPIYDSKGDAIGLQGVFWDVTEKHEAEAALEEARRRQELYFSQTPLGIIEWDADFKVVDWNPGAQKVFGYSKEEALGRHAEFIIPEEAKPHVDAIWAELKKNSGGDRSSNPNIHKEGRIIHCEWHNTPLVGANGDVIGVTSLVSDVTSLTEAKVEQERIEKKLQETQKLESLGVLAGGIAHDFNNLLTGILAHASMVGMRLPEDSPVSDSVRTIVDSSKRAAELCSQMLAYSGRGKFVIQAMDLNDLLRETTNLLQLSISKKAQLRFYLDGALPFVRADQTQIRQIIMNLVINASEAIGADAGVITIRTEIGDMKSVPSSPGFEELKSDQDYVVMEISDTGCGMDEETRKRVFDPFYTTKFTGRGLGLAAVQGIVRGHSGAMQLASDAGEGTTFQIWLPVADETMIPDGEDTADKDSDDDHEGLALIVDDEEMVRSVTTDILEITGFKVLTAADGVEGLERFVRADGKVDIVILDLTMPRMDGVETLREIRKMDEKVPVLLISGFSEQEAVTKFDGMGLSGFLHKPFTADSMIKKIGEVLSLSRNGD